MTRTRRGFLTAILGALSATGAALADFIRDEGDAACLEVAGDDVRFVFSVAQADFIEVAQMLTGRVNGDPWSGLPSCSVLIYGVEGEPLPGTRDKRWRVLVTAGKAAAGGRWDEVNGRRVLDRSGEPLWPSVTLAALRAVPTVRFDQPMPPRRYPIGFGVSAKQAIAKQEAYGWQR